MDKMLLKAWLTKTEVKQEELADLLGVTRNTVSRKINGSVKVTTDEAKKICDYLGIYDLDERAKIFLS